MFPAIYLGTPFTAARAHSLASSWQMAELEAKLRLGMLSKKEQAKLGPQLLAEAEAQAVARQNAHKMQSGLVADPASGQWC